MDLKNLTITNIHEGLAKKEFSAKDLAVAYLDAIKKRDGKINAFLSVTEDLALEQAKAADEIVSKNPVFPMLLGVPMAIKDNILVDGYKTTCASKILEKYVAPYDATCIKKIKKEGALILGKTNMDEFAMGASTENSAFLKTKNPVDLERVPGGSSGGSVAAVAADFCCCALGSDTGGSIRQPASFCGVVGLKPTYGAVSRYGLVAFASSLDQIGPITKNVKDAEIIFDIISGKDNLDSTSVEAEFKNLDIDPKEITIGVPKEYFIKGLDSGVEKVIKNTIEKLQNIGVKVVEVSLPHTEYAVPAYYLICMSEASANLSRYDGIRYGLSENSKNGDLMGVYLKSRDKGFGKEVKRRIMLGTFSLSSGYYDAYYLKAQKVRQLIKDDFNEAFKKVDFVISPTAPSTAFKIGEKIEDPVAMYLCDIYTAPVNLAGLPAMSIPVGLTDSLPVGLQIIGQPFQEKKMFRMGEIIEKIIKS